MAKIKLVANQSFDGVEGFVKSGETFEVANEERAKKLVEELKFADYTDADAEVTQEHSLEDYTVPELKERAKDLNIEGYSNLLKDELIAAIQQVTTSRTTNDGAATTSNEPDNTTEQTNRTAAATTTNETVNETATDETNTPAQLQTTKTGNETRKK